MKTSILKVICSCVIFGVSLSVNSQMPLDEKWNDLKLHFSELYKNQPVLAENFANDLIGKGSSDYEKSKISGRIAVWYFEKNNVDKSTELLFESKKFAEKTGDHQLMAETLGSISHQYVQLNLKSNAKIYLDKAIEQIEFLPEGNEKKSLKALSFLEQGNLYFDDKLFKNANESYRNALGQFSQMIEPGGEVSYHYRRSFYNIGNSYLYLNQLDSAEWYLKRSLIMKNDNNKELNNFIYNALSEVYAAKGKYNRSVDTLLVLLRKDVIHNEKLKSTVYLNLANNYKKLGEKDNYILYNEKYIKLHDSLQKNDLDAIGKAMIEENKDASAALGKADIRNKHIIFYSLSGGLVLCLFIFFLIFKRQKEKRAFENLLEKMKVEESQQLIKNGSKESESLSIEKSTNQIETQLLDKLKKFEDSEKFLNSKLTISSLAVQLKTNTTYLSEVINKHKGKNFNLYINELRIHYICNKMLLDSKYLSYKISYLAEVSGFTSHSSFATVFKNITGVSPSVFIRELSAIK